MRFWKYISIPIFLVLAVTAWATTQATIDTEINTNLASGKAPPISASILRTTLHDLNAAIPHLDVVHTWQALQTFLSGISVTGGSTFAYDGTAQTFSIGTSVMDIGRKTLAPGSIIPTTTMLTVGKGDNTNFIGVSGGFWKVADDPSVDANSKGVLYGLQIAMAPQVTRNNVPFDDVGALIVTNASTNQSKGTDAIYLGHNAGFTGGAAEWGSSFTIDGNSDIAITARGTYSYGLDFCFSPGCATAHAVFNKAPIRGPLMTPASSTDTCDEGALKWDASFIYVCIANNTWRRATLNAF